MTLLSARRPAARSAKHAHILSNSVPGSQNRDEEQGLHSACIEPSTSAVRESIELAFGDADDRTRSPAHR